MFIFDKVKFEFVRTQTKIYQHPEQKVPWLILGSAPNPQLPSGQLNKMNLVCVNGSGWSAKQLGLLTPELTVMGGSILTKPSAEASREAIKSLKTRKLLLIEYEVTLAEAREILIRLDYQYEELQVIRYKRRAGIIKAATGKNLGYGHNDKSKISNGLFAACFSLYQGAPEVILSGISLNSNGHNYSNTLQIRSHVVPDKEAIIAMYRRQLPIRTSEPELAELIGIDLV